MVHFLPDGIYVAPKITGTIHAHDPNDISKGRYVDSAVFTISAEVINADNEERKAYFFTTLYNEAGNKVASGPVIPNTIDNGGEIIKTMSSITATNVELWSSARPYVYTVKCDLVTGDVIDTINITVGVHSASSLGS